MTMGPIPCRSGSRTDSQPLRGRPADWRQVQPSARGLHGLGTWCVAGLALLYLHVVGTRPLAAADEGKVVYRDNFQVAQHWSERTISDTPTGRKYLGPFRNQTVTLSLDKLPEHAWVKLRFKLYMQGTWDGSSPIWGSDLWSLSVPGQQRLIFASFCNMGYFTDNNEQSYPDDYPTAIHPAWTGTLEKIARVTPGKKGSGKPLRRRLSNGCGFSAQGRGTEAGFRRDL